MLTSKTIVELGDAIIFTPKFCTSGRRREQGKWGEHRTAYRALAGEVI